MFLWYKKTKCTLYAEHRSVITLYKNTQHQTRSYSTVMTVLLFGAAIASRKHFSCKPKVNLHACPQ